MERPRIIIDSKNLNPIFEHIFQNAMGLPIILTAAPTQASDMKGNVFGFYNDKLYIVLSNGNLYSINLTEI